jgi:hypothetical chaperone protein
LSKTTLAIDFGTTNSLVGAVKDGKRIEAIPLDPSAADPTLMRTLLYFPDQDQCFYGQNAIEKFLEYEMDGRLFRSFKTHLPNKNYLGTMIGKRVLSLENLVGIFLLELKKRAETALGETVTRAVIGRPARYSMDEVAHEFAIYRMQKAAEFAGFTEIEFVPEPTAAALDFRRDLKSEKKVLIGDFGGGTSDFTIMKMSQASFKKTDVLGVDGCSMAGDALDSVFMSERLNRSFGAMSAYQLPMSSNILRMPAAVMDRLNKPAHIVHLKDRETYNFLKEVQKCALTEQDKKSLQRLFIMIEDQQIFPFFEVIEKTKRELSTQEKSNFSFDYPDLEIGDVFFRKEFEHWSEKVQENIFAALDRCLNQAGLKDSDIDVVVLTGGTAHVPMMRARFAARFGQEKMQMQTYFHSVLSGLIEAAAQEPGAWV